MSGKRQGSNLDLKQTVKSPPHKLSKISQLGNRFKSTRDPNSIKWVGSNVIKNGEGREVPEVAEVGVCFNIFYWGGKPREDEASYKCTDFPCNKYHGNSDCCYWLAVKARHEPTPKTNVGVFNYETCSTSDPKFAGSNTNLVKVDLERCGGLNFNQELCMYGVLGLYGEDDLEVNYLDEGVTLCKYYFKKRLQKLLDDLGGAKKCLKSIRTVDVEDVTERWKETPHNRVTTMSKGQFKCGSLVDNLPVEGRVHVPMMTTQYKRLAWVTSPTQVAYSKTNKQTMDLDETVDSTFDSRATFLWWSGIKGESTGIVGNLSCDGHLPERITCPGVFGAFSDDWAVRSTLSGLLRGYTDMWRDVVFALYGSVKLAACRPGVKSPVVVLHGQTIGELVPLTAKRATSRWLGDGPLPAFLSKGSLEKGGPLTLKATRECGFLGLSEFPVINLGTNMYNRIIYGAGPASFYCACVDAMFYYDYGLRDVGASIAKWYDAIEKLATIYQPSGTCKCAYYFYERGRSALVACHGLNYKRALEDSLRANNVRSRGLALKWVDRRLMAEFCFVDSAVPAFLVDCSLSRTNRWDAVMSRLINDFVDFGFDVSCSEIGNVVFTVSDGQVTEEAIRESYRHFCHSLNSMYETRAGQIVAIVTVVTGLWQLANYRQRTMQFMVIAASDGVDYCPVTEKNDPESCIINGTCGQGDGPRPQIVEVPVSPEYRLPLAIDRVTCSVDWVTFIAKAGELSWAKHLEKVVMSYKILLKAAKQGLLRNEPSVVDLFNYVEDMCCAALTYASRDCDWRMVDGFWRAVLELYCFDGIGFYACRGSLVVIKERAVGDEREGFSYSQRPFS